MQLKEVGVKFDNQPKIYLFDASNLNLKIGDFVVAETIRGLELGKVATPMKNIEKDSKEPLKKLHLASEKEIETANQNKIKAKEYMVKTKKIVKNLGLAMKLISADMILDKSKIIISFSSENRVDFRELVKILAQEFKIKIELRQIGSRDEVKILGGIGICGKSCCCCENTGDFEHVTIKMAKTQGLSLNPNNISGLCGRLLCCLAYENSQYAEVLKLMPKINSEVMTPEGKGKVLYNHLLKKKVCVRVNDNYRDFDLKDINFSKNQNITDKKLDGEENE
ncbi:MAG: regulatory iron-sulfur-containing complex subunit RicT [Clostridia bacterium]|nr:regulatory iron-sulfur-containing complex subunit RicT [Clostridia bacterium]